MTCQSYPCTDCNDVILIGEGQGLCDYKNRVDAFKPSGIIVVDIFEVRASCPKPIKKGRKT